VRGFGQGFRAAVQPLVDGWQAIAACWIWCSDTCGPATIRTRQGRLSCVVGAEFSGSSSIRDGKIEHSHSATWPASPGLRRTINSCSYFWASNTATVRFGDIGSAFSCSGTLTTTCVLISGRTASRDTSPLQHSGLRHDAQAHRDGAIALHCIFERHSHSSAFLNQMLSLLCSQITAEKIKQDAITTSSKQQHYHPKRLLITLHEHPTSAQEQQAEVLPEGLELKSVINNSPHGANSRHAPTADDLIYVAHVPEGGDAADYIHQVLANARESAAVLHTRE